MNRPDQTWNFILFYLIEIFVQIDSRIPGKIIVISMRKARWHLQILSNIFNQIRKTANGKQRGKFH